MSHRKSKLEADLGKFVQQYRRKAPRGKEPNDRRYDREVEKRAKALRPEELDELLRGSVDEDQG